MLFPQRRAVDSNVSKFDLLWMFVWNSMLILYTCFYNRIWKPLIYSMDLDTPNVWPVIHKGTKTVPWMKELPSPQTLAFMFFLSKFPLLPNQYWILWPSFKYSAPQQFNKEHSFSSKINNILLNGLYSEFWVSLVEK